ncbi:MAG: FtsX-like permease family protein [Clostridia bacterium]|nr:FtsX-like permease family protein [Clostridia bacterium]
MKILLKHIFRNIKEHKIRSLLIIVALSIATTVLILNITLPDEIILKIHETLRSVYGETDISVSTVEPFNEKDLNLGNEEIDIVGMSMIQMEKKNGDAIAIYGFNIEDAKEIKLIGDDIPALEENEVAVSKRIADKSDYNVGDKISVKYEEKEYELKIVKIIENKGLASVTIDNDLFFANIKTVNDIKQIDENKFETLYINVHDDDKINDVKDYIKENNDNYIVQRLVDPDAIREEASFINYIMILIFAMATIMIFFVISSLNKIILAERFPVIGTFRSIGANKGKMNFILVLENAMYGLVAGSIGSVVGNILKGKAAGLFLNFEGAEMTKETAQMSPQLVIIGIVFAVLLQIFITIRAIIKTNKKPIKDIIFNTQNTRYKISKIKNTLGVILIIVAFIVNGINNKSDIVLTLIALVSFIVGTANVVPVLMRLISYGLHILFRKLGFATCNVACKNIGYNKMIISSSRLIVVAVSLMLTIITVSASFTNMINSFKFVTEGYDIIISGVGKTEDNYENLKDLDGVEDVQYMYYFADENTTYNNGKKFKSYPVMYGAKESVSYIKEFDYKIKDLKYDEILVDEKFAEKNNIDIDDKLKIKFDTIEKEIEYKVVGFVNSTYFSVQRDTIIVNLDNFIENLTNKPVQVQLKCSDDADLDEIKEKAEKKIKEVGLKIQTVDEFLKEQSDQMASIMSMFYVIIGLAMALSFIGIVNNQIIGFIQRRRELAVLNSTCMSKKQIKKMLVLETAIANLISCALAFAIGVLSTGIIDKFMQGLSMYVDIAFNYSAGLIFAGGVYIALLLTLVIPARRLRKMNIVNEIKYE